MPAKLLIAHGAGSRKMKWSGVKISSRIHTMSWLERKKLLHGHVARIDPTMPTCCMSDGRFHLYEAPGTPEQKKLERFVERERGPGKKESNCRPFRKQLLWLVSMYRNHAGQRSTNFPNMWHSEVNTSQVSQLMSRVDMNMNEMSNSNDFLLYRITAFRVLWNCCTINNDYHKIERNCRNFAGFWIFPGATRACNPWNAPWGGEDSRSENVVKRLASDFAGQRFTQLQLISYRPWMDRQDWQSERFLVMFLQHHNSTTRYNNKVTS